MDLLVHLDHCPLGVYDGGAFGRPGEKQVISLRSMKEEQVVDWIVRMDELQEKVRKSFA